MGSRQTAVLLLVASLVTQCRGSTSTASTVDCMAILDRIVDIELAERGFHDPVLTERLRDAARRTHAPDLRVCEGAPLLSGAMDCVRGAQTAEEVSHVCLR